MLWRPVTREAPLLLRAAYSLFYRIMNRSAEHEWPPDVGDFSVISARCQRTLLALPEHSRMLRGLRSWVGFRQEEISYNRPARRLGTSKYNVRKLIALALQGLISFSHVPLRLATVIGAGVGLLSLVFGAMVFLNRLVPSFTLFGYWIGCGHGILQWQIEDGFNRVVTGFDLNEVALKQTVSRTSAVCCYDVFQRSRPTMGDSTSCFCSTYWSTSRTSAAFINAIRFHMAPGGSLVINVPAMPSQWSKYDEAVGHFRRYDIDMLNHVARTFGLIVHTGAIGAIGAFRSRHFWLAVRPGSRLGQTDRSFLRRLSSRGGALNRLLSALSVREDSATSARFVADDSARVDTEVSMNATESSGFQSPLAQANERAAPAMSA